MTRHRHENMTHDKEENQLIKTNQKLPDMLELGKDIKSYYYYISDFKKVK